MSEHEDRTAPTEQLPGAPTPTAPQAGSKTGAPTPIPTTRPARFGTILWGVVLLVFAAAMFTSTITEMRIDPLTWITGGLIATGAVLVLAGIAAAVRRRP
ncbi:hypothetical protein KXS11_07075 [Plantibacter flavus]|uniref:hypothetical protein n=1 Tax=Plantibacter flavus TaxID=150123 RepID=UPI003F163D98